MCQSFQRSIRQKNDDKRLADIQKVAIKQFIDWQVKDEATRDKFIQKVHENLDRINHIDPFKFDQDTILKEW